MKKRNLMVLLVVLVAMCLLVGCGAAGQKASSAEEEKIYVVPDSHLSEDAYDPKIYGIDELAPLLEIPDASVPLASTYVDVSDGASERESEALAIHHAGLRNEDVSYLHSRYVEDADVPYYHIEFSSHDIHYIVWVSEATGEILLFEEAI